MISFFLDRDNAYTMRNYLGYRGKSIKSSFDIITYQKLPEIQRFNSSAFIFTDLERLPIPQKQNLTQFADYVASKGCTILNHPDSVLSRYQLLRQLYSQGVNPHNVYLLTESHQSIKFPVFLRHKDHHTGPLTPLLYDENQIVKYSRLLALSGHHQDNLMIVEFVDVGARNGLYKKFSALKVGVSLIPRHLGYDDRWLVKANGDKSYKQSKDYLDEFRHFMCDFPHRDWVSNVFSTAGIDYGRIDYSIIGDQLVAWEINLNPDYGSGSNNKKRDEPEEIAILKSENHDQLRDAFNVLISADAKEVVIPQDLLNANSFSLKRSTSEHFRYIFKMLTTSLPMLKRLVSLYRGILNKVLR